MKSLLTLLCTVALSTLSAQTSAVQGQLQDELDEAVIFANVALYNQTDSTLVKVETTDEVGVFRIQGLSAGQYFLVATYIGLQELRQEELVLTEGQLLDLGILSFAPAAVELAEATVVAQRAMVEIKPDRTVFNVQGTINSTGSDALSLLRKAPGVTVDNNDNVNVLGRAGVLLYVDGKRLPLTGDDLSNYLENIPADQIDRIDIITNPGAKYEAEGNAGIIDIRLKKDKNLGANGSASTTFSQGKFGKLNGSLSGNYRNKIMNVFGSLGYADGAGFNDIMFINNQNGLRLNELNEFRFDWKNVNLRLGTDFFLGTKHTIGFLVGANMNDVTNKTLNRIEIANGITPTTIDSILVANNRADNQRDQNTYNINYRFDGGKGQTINVDLDYGRYENRSSRMQPNRYYDATESELLTEVINSYETPTDIDIYTAKVDYENELWGGVFGAGTKISRVVSDNTFLRYDIFDGLETLNNTYSNEFTYDENVFAGYLSYNRSINEKWSFTAGVRAEQTDAMGNLVAYDPDLEAPPVELNYLSWFPNAGVTWQVTPMKTLNLSYGRRINRPDYNVLNPFNNRLSELSYEKGNPFLNPEIVNNLELGYTLNYRYNFKLAYSKTTDQITRLIGADQIDERASYISWSNLAHQEVYSFNISAPVTIKKGWNAYFNVSASYLDNQADYGNGAIVDVQAFTYSIFQQQTFDLPGGFKGEVSGYFSGPGIWGGVFKYETSWSLDLGLQKKFFNDQLNVRLSASDLFYETGWDGVSVFDGLESTGGGRWDSRRVSLSLSYNFGNQNVKSRKRKTGLEEEAGRVGSGQN